MTPSGLPKYPSPITSSIPGQAKCNLPDGTTALPLIPDIPQAILGSQLPGLPISSHAVSAGSGRPAMVGTVSHLLEWKKSNFPSLNNSDIDLDDSLQGWRAGEINQRSLVPPGTDSTHQLPGTSGGYTSSSNIGN